MAITMEVEFGCNISQHVANSVKGSSDAMSIWDILVEYYFNFVFLTICGVFGIIVEVFAFIFILRNRMRPSLSTLSLINLHIATILAILNPILRVIRDLDNSPCKLGYFSCGFCVFIARLTVCIQPYTMMAIFYELIGSNIMNNANSVKKRIHKFVVLTLPWIASVLLSLPVMIIYTFVEPDGEGERGKCVRDRQFGKKIHVLIDFTSIFLLVILPPAYMVYVMRRVGFRTKFLFFCKKIPAYIPSQKIRRVRMVFFYMLTFIFTWAPIGFITAIYLAAASFSKLVDENRKSRGLDSIVLGIFLGQLSLHPLFYMWTIYDVSLADCVTKFKCCVCGVLRKPKTAHDESPSCAVVSSIYQLETFQLRQIRSEFRIRVQDV